MGLTIIVSISTNPTMWKYKRRGVCGHFPMLEFGAVTGEREVKRKLRWPPSSCCLLCARPFIALEARARHYPTGIAGGPPCN